MRTLATGLTCLLMVLTCVLVLPGCAGMTIQKTDPATAQPLFINAKGEETALAVDPVSGRPNAPEMIPNPAIGGGIAAVGQATSALPFPFNLIGLAVTTLGGGALTAATQYLKNKAQNDAQKAYIQQTVTTPDGVKAVKALKPKHQRAIAKVANAAPVVAPVSA